MPLIAVIKVLFQARYLSAIAILGIVLSLSGKTQLIKQTGTAIAIGASGALIATIIQHDNAQMTEQIQEETYLSELEQIQADYEQREASLNALVNMSIAEANTLKERIAQMQDVLADDQVEKVSIFEAFQTLEKEHQHVLHDLREMAIAQSRIPELETALAHKTHLATQMLTELEAEATSTFTQFNAKITAQAELIDTLQHQLEVLQTKNAALTRAQFNQQIGHIGSPHQI